MPDNHVTKLVAVLASAFDAGEIKIILTSGDPLPDPGFGNETVECKIIGAVALRNNANGPSPTISSSLLASHGHHWNILGIVDASIAIPDQAFVLQKAFWCGLALSISKSGYIPGKSALHLEFDAFVIVEYRSELFAIRYIGDQSIGDKRIAFEYRRIMDGDYGRHLLTPDHRP